MKKLYLSLIVILAVAVSASAASYTIDDEAIDALVEASVEVSPLTLMAEVPAAVPAAASLSRGSADPVGALLICTFVGCFGIHRHYMGTRPFMWLIYTITGGGLGIVTVIDWVMLLVGVVEDDISDYCGNTKFLMWA